MHAEVGDMVEVVLRNTLDFPINIISGGVSASSAESSINPGDTATTR
jgi:hypothetical protein